MEYAPCDWTWLLLGRDHGDLEVGVAVAARVDDVIALVDQPVIEKQGVVRHRAVALDKEAQALALAE